jgi:putative transposase
MSLIEPKSEAVPVLRQCELFGLPRSSVYYRPKPSALNLALMHRLDELFTAYPFLGYRKLTVMLRAEGHAVNAKRIRRLLRQMGLMAVYQVPDTSRKHPGHRIYPYLLKGVAITKPGQVWATDISVPQQSAWEMEVGPP